MNKLEAINKIAQAEGVIDSSKISGILSVLNSDEDSAETIADSFSKPRTQHLREKIQIKKGCS